MGRLQTFKIHCGTFDYNIDVVIGKDKELVKKFIKKKHKALPDNINVFDIAHGMIIRYEGFNPILWLPAKPRTPSELATMSHEIFHLVYTVLSYVGITLSESSEEVFCYLIGHLTKQVIEKAK